MILSGSKIKEEIGRNIFIEPFNEKKLNSNSYNLTLQNKLLIYVDDVLDMKVKNETIQVIIPDEGYVLQPGELYLGCTIERTFSNKYIPIIEGRSSIGRLGLFVHISAGLGEAGFDGKWTLELSCIKPIRIYPQIDICQIYFNEISGKIDVCQSEKYQYSKNTIASKLYQEWER